MSILGGIGYPSKRARRELEADLSSISDRLDSLESAPAPELTKQHLERAVEAILQSLEQRLGPVESRLDGVESALEDGERRVKALTFAVEEGIERVSRTERRIHATIKRARKELADHGLADPGLESEAQELRLVDGAGSEAGGVQPMPESVAEADDPPSSVKGVPASILRRVRGF